MTNQHVTLPRGQVPGKLFCWNGGAEGIRNARQGLSISGHPVDAGAGADSADVGTEWLFPSLLSSQSFHRITTPRSCGIYGEEYDRYVIEIQPTETCGPPSVPGYLRCAGAVESTTHGRMQCQTCC